MDPVSAAGIGMGAASLAFDVFDKTISGFKFLTGIVSMPEECKQLRLQLIIEFNRVLAWGDAAGLIEATEGIPVVVSLGANALELCSIVARLGALLEEFKEINARYNELDAYEGGDKAVAETRATDVDLVAEVSSLAKKYEEQKALIDEKPKHMRGTNHLRRIFSSGVKNGAEILKHPKRVRWVLIDSETFVALLKDIHFLTERLSELMDDYRMRRIDEITAKAFREMVLVRNDVQDLKDMFTAATNVIRASTDARKERGAHLNSKVFRDLIQLKRISQKSEDILSGVSKYSNLTTEVKQINNETWERDFSWTEPMELQNPEELERPRGAWGLNESKTFVWIEWKTLGDVAPGSKRDTESKLRTAALAEMLHSLKPKDLRSPTCIGYFDDREIHGLQRFGWMFKMPEGATEGTKIRSLFEILGQNKYRPTLSQRISVATKLASSLLYLHTVNWLHKGIRSENVIFHFNEDDEYDPEKLILSGFEYSRPEGSGTTARSLEQKWDIYRWPGIQREVPRIGNSQKTYDIYSLGLVLLEIAHWRPLHKIMGFSGTDVPLEESQKIRMWLLGSEVNPPFKDANPLVELRHLVDEKYHVAVTKCIEAHGEKGFGVSESVDQAVNPEVGLQLLDAFTENVVEELKSIDI